MRTRSSILTVLVLCLLLPTVSTSSDLDFQIDTLKPSFVPVLDLLDLLGAQYIDGIYRVTWEESGAYHSVEIRAHETANMLIMSGHPDEVSTVRGLAEALDIPPHQIEIEAKIVEVDRAAATDLGIDWEGMWASSGTRAGFNFSDRNRSNTDDRQTRESRDLARDVTVSTTARVSDFVNLLDETGAGTVRNTPRILTLNNRPARILDGQRVTYVTRASSFANIYETQTMDAGLKLEVLPTLGESGYLTLTITAELTGLASTDISGSPIKDGQIIENMVIVKDGDTVLLGGFQRHVDLKSKKRFPLLGHVLPFLFSREVTTVQTLDSFIALTARVVDLNPVMDEGTRKIIEGR